jgi:hypothetical protein
MRAVYTKIASAPFISPKPEMILTGESVQLATLATITGDY